MIEAQIKQAIRDIPDFPKPGILFKDITPILKNPALCSAMVDAFVEKLKGTEIDCIAGIESRGFLFGLMLANKLGIPFIPIRKQGKLPAQTISQTYDLEYGSATLEIHQDALLPGQKVLIHDDLLATGGTVMAAAQLIQQLGGNIAGFAFLVSLDFLNGKEKINPFSENIVILASF